MWAWARSNPEAWPEQDARIILDGECVQPEQLVRLVDLMLERGYGDEVVRGVLGENYLRVAAQVWQ